MRNTVNRILTAAVLCAVGAVTAAAPPATALGSGFVLHHVLVGTTQQSTNWSGYVSTSGPLTSVSASWVQPTGTCTAADTYSSFWVGLDGDGSNTVEQTGTEVDCSGRHAVYSAWYEMYPNPARLLRQTVKPGDTLTASVTASGKLFTLVLDDVTQGWTRTEVKTSGAAHKASAEIIAEAPANSNGVLPLTDFGTVQFTDAVANGQAIGNVGGQEIIMSAGGVTKAVPSALTSGEDFYDTWEHT